MIAPFVEAVRATAQPCTFLLIVPCVVAVVAARATRWSLVAVLSGAVVGGWWFAANRVVLDGWWLRLTAAAVGVALAGVIVTAVVAEDRLRWRRWRDHRTQAAVAGGISLVATQWWRPCVGEELGEILTNAPTGIVGQLPAMTAYMLGAMLPVVAIVLFVRTIEPSTVAMDVTAVIAGAVGIVVAGALVLGRHDDVVVTLTRWTLE